MPGKVIQLIKALPRDRRLRADTFEALAAQIEARPAGVGRQSTVATLMVPRFFREGEAARFIEQIDDPATRSLVNMAFVHLVRIVHLERRDAPDGDLDALFR